MKLRIILEALEDKPSRVVYHYTNIYSLEEILENGYLKGGTRSTPTRKGSLELAVVRPSSPVGKGTKAESLSGQTDPNIKFILYPERIQDAVRGIKLRTVADYPSQEIQSAKNALSFRIQDITKNQLDKLTNIVLKAVQKRKSSYKKPAHYASKRDIKEIQQEILDSNLPSNIKSHFQNLKDIEGVLGRVWSIHKMILDTQKTREGEERITLPPNQTIPLDARYMKLEINFTDNFKDKLNELLFGYDPENEEEDTEGKEAKQFMKNMKKHKDVFTDKSYKDLMNYLVSVMRKRI